MNKKSDLLKELGWDDNLISHYMIDDSILIQTQNEQPFFEVYESNTLTISYNSLPPVFIGATSKKL